MKTVPSSCDTARNFPCRRPIVFLLLVGALVASGGMATCNQLPCTPLDPNYNPDTGLCTTATSDGTTIFPGAGGLPAEPGTTQPTTQPAADHDPDSVDLNIFGLGGKWKDNNRDACFRHTGSGVFATYYLPFQCDHADDTNMVSMTHEDFTAQLSGKMLTGTTSVCIFGQSDTSINGIQTATMTLTVSDDGKSMSGSWQHDGTGTGGSITITRLTVGDCQVLGN
jgi:hypothetical protein